MKNRLLITISNSNGTKSFKVHKTVPKLIFIIIIIGLALFFIALLFINSLNSTVAKLKQKEQILQTQSKLYSLKIEDKINDIKELSNKLDNIESMIGINTSRYLDEMSRVNSAQITAKERTNILKIIPSASPLKTHEGLTSRFGYRIHPVSKNRKLHKGLDFRAKIGTPIYATADGVAKYVQSKNVGSFGRLITISHNYGFETLFAHLNKTTIKIGDVIYKGDLIGYTGNSGRSSGPHLHYEVKYAVNSLNPKYFVNWDIKNYEYIFKKIKKVPWDYVLNQIKLHEMKFKNIYVYK